MGSPSRNSCATSPSASVFWSYEEVAPHWDELILRAHVIVGGKSVLYQEGAVTAMMHPQALMEKHSSTSLREGTLLFGGTLAAHGGVRPTPEFSFELEDPVLGRKIAHRYRVRVLPILG
jgi:hypothetical protein